VLFHVRVITTQQGARRDSHAQVLANGMSHALEQLLMEPFATLHRTLAKVSGQQCHNTMGTGALSQRPQAGPRGF
jgi:hypothetical protein